ncbi:hypothetical protein KDA23_03730 [Candidatus Saccharibacteria bacterium]|nr:hypothetical protein [Candidatus Saccharibacteria bacterium]
MNRQTIETAPILPSRDLQLLELFGVEVRYHYLAFDNPEAGKKFWDTAYGQFCRSYGLTPQSGEEMAWEVNLRWEESTQHD